MQNVGTRNKGAWGRVPDCTGHTEADWCATKFRSQCTCRGGLFAREGRYQVLVSHVWTSTSVHHPNTHCSLEIGIHHLFTSQTAGACSTRNRLTNRRGWSGWTIPWGECQTGSWMTNLCRDSTLQSLSIQEIGHRTASCTRTRSTLWSGQAT